MNEIVMADKKPDVSQAFDSLISRIDECIQGSYNTIQGFAADHDGSKIESSIAAIQEIERIKTQVCASKNAWKSLFTVAQASGTVPAGKPRLNDVADRTSWKKANDSIRVETSRVDGPAYSNAFPLTVFKKIAKSAYDFAQQNGYVKTSDVFNALKNEIIANSDYKRAPRMPIYATFKVLVKENLLKIDENNSHKYLQTTTKDDLDHWLNSIV